MYGSRARIGYTSPLLLTEVILHEFYMVAPKGVSVMVSSGVVWDATREEMLKTRKLHIDQAEQLGKAGAGIVVLGCVPVNMLDGFKRIGEHMRECEERSGVPVATSVTTQINALRQLGAKRIGQIHIQTPPPIPSREDDYLAQCGFQTVVDKGVGSSPSQVGGLDSQANVRAAREVLKAHPEIDTLYFPGPHRATLDIIQAMENEFGVNVVTAAQAIFWEAFRRCGIKEPIPGFGRLLREPWDGQSKW